MVMEQPEVQNAIKTKLEEKIKSDLENPRLQRGWEQVRKGGECIYPDCHKPSYSAAFHGLPLCREHFDLSQWISYVIYTIEENKNP